MCGRFTVASGTDELVEDFYEKYGAQELVSDEPRYNVAPTQRVTALRQSASTGERKAEVFRWGLIPFWAKDASIGSRMINARSETVAEKPSFRHAYKKRRCILPVTGFYEWKRDGRHKQPFYITPREGNFLPMAGLWETWNDREHEGEKVLSLTILTTSPNGVMEELHDRMPVILDPVDFDHWLDTTVPPDEALAALMKPCPNVWLQTWPVSPLVNSPRNDSPELIKPLPADGTPDLFSLS